MADEVNPEQFILRKSNLWFSMSFFLIEHLLETSFVELLDYMIDEQQPHH
jgi:hypothetical protein